MRKLVSLTSLVLLLPLTQGCQAESAESSAFEKQLTSQIDYTFVGNLGQSDKEGRLLVWQGTIEGDLTGEIRWWFVLPSPVSEAVLDNGRVAYYEARWEVWVAGELILAGQSAGKTVFRDGEDGIWDGHGIVTDASDRFVDLKGRSVYETGPVIVGQNPPDSFSGRGLFSIH